MSDIDIRSLLPLEMIRRYSLSFGWYYDLEESKVPIEEDEAVIEVIEDDVPKVKILEVQAEKIGSSEATPIVIEDDNQELEPVRRSRGRPRGSKKTPKVPSGRPRGRPRKNIAP